MAQPQMPPGLPPQYPQPPRVSWSAMPAQSPPAPGSMGPPSRPADRGSRASKATDINDLSDAVTAAGIDVADEENYLNEIYNNRPSSTSFNTSFTSQSSATISPDNSFGAWSQGSVGAFQGIGPISQPAKTPEDLEREVKEKHERAAEVINEHRSHTLNDPFLLGNCVRNRLLRRCYEHGLQLNMDGNFNKLPETPQGIHGRFANGPNGTGVAVVKGHSILQHDASLTDIISLMSLATNERMRSLLEDAYSLSRNRQISSHGTVPPDFASIATGEEQPKDATVTVSSVSGTAWDQPRSSASPSGNSLKRPHPSSANLPTPPTDGPPTPQQTIFFPSTLINSFRTIASRDRKHEEARLARRTKRRKLSAATDNADSASVADATAAADAAAVNTKLTKKERDKLAKSNQTEEVLHREANKTASMALGAGGKKYSWLTGGAGKGGGGGGLSTAKASTPAKGSTISKQSDKGVQGRDRRYGDFREDTVKGRGIQLRDLLAVLEIDGREKKTLVKGYTRLRSSDG